MNSQTMVEILNRLLEAELMALEYYRVHAEAIPEKDIAEGIWGILPTEENHAMNLANRIRELCGVPIEPGGSAKRLESGAMQIPGCEQKMAGLTISFKRKAIK